MFHGHMSAAGNRLVAYQLAAFFAAPNGAPAH
jgi:hypothetical protein